MIIVLRKLLSRHFRRYSFANLLKNIKMLVGSNGAGK
jgi:recombinational DNA repair ATPase RecF